MTTLLAPNRLSSLQRYLTITVTASVINCWALDRDSIVVAAWDRNVDGNLVAALRHVCLDVELMACDVAG